MKTPSLVTAAAASAQINSLNSFKSLPQRCPYHRRRLLEMTVGARFPAFLSPFPLPSCPPSPLASLPSYLSFHCHPFLPSLLPSCLIPFPLPCPYSYPLNPAWGMGKHCKLPSGYGQSTAAKRFRCIFRLKSTHFFQFHNDTFVIFTVPFGCVERRHNKISVGATWGHRTHNVLAVGAIHHPSITPWSRHLWLL